MDIASNKVCKLFFAFTLTLGMIFSTMGITIPHSPASFEIAEQTRHAELTIRTDDHGHSHDDGDFEERQTHHAHGHNPTDHSHEIPHLLTYLSSISRDITPTHFRTVQTSNELGVFTRLDRPPKSISLI